MFIENSELRKINEKLAMMSQFDLTLFFFFSPLMCNHTTSSQLYYKYL